jgi:uncharacterized 2Fe-2S/4Fe-4S cluster protein (DUF4445 family)
MSLTLRLDACTGPVPPEGTLYDAAGSLGVTLPSSCRQQGRCRECIVEVVSGAELLRPAVAEERHLPPGFRLSCRCQPLPGATGEVVARSLQRASLRIEERAAFLPRPEVTAVLDPAVTRVAGRVFLDRDPVDAGPGPLLGVAVDLGTTTVALRVIDLESGATAASAAFENPQRFGGSDVMSRIQFESVNPGRLLQRAVLGQLARCLSALPVPASRIFEYAIAGNTTMRDLFFGLDVQPIGQRPYRSVTETAWRAGRAPGTSLGVRAAALRLPGHPAARVYGLPLVGGHVGADAAACLLALEPHRADAPVAIMDIGTNTELFIGDRRRLLAASCPAGPAFEGGAVSCGLPGLPGAIARVRIDGAGRFATEVIGGGEAEGICGSGLVDLLAELLRTGRMNVRGRFESGDESMPIDDHGRVVFRESDVNELAQAKGANVAGLRIVARRLGVDLGDLDRFFLAGGFGRHLDASAARRIGLIPDLPDGRIHSVGNIAIEGAAIALRSVTLRRELEALVTTVEHVELETDPDFFDHFVAGCQFQTAGAPLEAMP